MDPEDAHIGNAHGAPPSQEDPGPSQTPHDETKPEGPEPSAGRPKRRRSWKRWLANLMIIGGILLLAYPVGTWAYTWYEQRGLRAQLERENPGMVVATTEFKPEDFISVETRGANAEQSSAAAASAAAAAAASAAEKAAAEAAILALEQERLLRLAEFRAAADAFEAKVGGETGEPLGQILIPSIGVDVIMIEGTNTGDLREGPGHWPETPFPGQGGNFVVSGHRTTYGAPFRKLDKLVEGDIIELVLPYGIARYAVGRVIIVNPDQVEEVAQLGREQVSLAACHPLYSAKQRIVAQGELISFKLTEPGG